MATSAVYIDFDEGSAPATPDAGKRRVYAKTDGVYEKDDAGTEAGPIGSTSGAGDITADDAWVAKGDLIVGTTTDTADILTAGSNGKAVVAASGETTGLKYDNIEGLATAEMDDSLVIAPDGAGGVEFRAEAGGGISSGTDQGPAGSAGTLYFRTDLLMLIVDDGTRWVTAQEYVWTTPHFDSVLSSDSIDARMALPLGYDVYLTRWDSFMRLSSSATWTLLLSSVDHENDETSIDTQQHVFANTNWWHYSNVLGNVISCAGSNAANEPTFLGVGYSEDSGSAALHAGASVYYRLIIPDPA